MTHERQKNDARPVSHLTVGRKDTFMACYNQEMGECHSQIGSHDDMQTIPPLELAFEELGILDGLF